VVVAAAPLLLQATAALVAGLVVVVHCINLHLLMQIFCQHLFLLLLVLRELEVLLEPLERLAVRRLLEHCLLYTVVLGAAPLYLGHLVMVGTALLQMYLLAPVLLQALGLVVPSIRLGAVVRLVEVLLAGAQYFLWVLVVLGVVL
jgi:hypothetical protein